MFGGKAEGYSVKKSGVDGSYSVWMPGIPEPVVYKRGTDGKLYIGFMSVTISNYMNDRMVRMIRWCIKVYDEEISQKSVQTAINFGDNYNG